MITNRNESKTRSNLSISASPPILSETALDQKILHHQPNQLPRSSITMNDGDAICKLDDIDEETLNSGAEG
jgi:hypothetical protein